VPVVVLPRYARDKPRFGDPLDAVKFICKEFWNEVFAKQVDNLKTNYRVRQQTTPAKQSRESFHSLHCGGGRACMC
jgi:hypothetical protein